MTKIYRVNIVLNQIIGTNNHDNSHSYIQAPLAPLICNTSAIRGESASFGTCSSLIMNGCTTRSDTFNSCSLNYKNRLKKINFDFPGIKNIRTLNITAHVNDRFTYQFDNRETKFLDSMYNVEFFYGNQAKLYIYNYKGNEYKIDVSAGYCKKVNIASVKQVVTNVNASGIISAFDSNGNEITSQFQSQNPNLQISRIPNSKKFEISLTGITLTINSALNISATDCNVGLNEITSTNAEKPSIKYPEMICSFKPKIFNYSSGITPIPLNPTDTTYVQRELNGEKSDTLNFFPNGLTKVYKNDISFDDLHGAAFFNNNIKLIAYVNKTYGCPRHSLVVKFYQNNITLTDNSISVPYAAFDSIRQVDVGAFNPTSTLLSWSIYLYNKHQFYILLNYIKQNVANYLTQISSYDGKFSVITFPYSNSFLVAYRELQYKITIANFSVTDNRLVENKHININVYPNHHSEFEIKNHTDGYISLVRSHNNIRGIFLQKYDLDLNRVGTEHNIICLPQTVRTTINGNHTIVAWQGVTSDFNQSHIYLQHIVGNELRERKNIFNGKVGLQLKGVKFSHNISHVNNYSNATNYVGHVFPNLPGNTSIMYRIGYQHYMLTFNHNLVMTGMKLFYQPGKALAPKLNQNPAHQAILGNAAKIAAIQASIAVAAGLAQAAASTMAQCDCERKELEEKENPEEGDEAEKENLEEKYNDAEEELDSKEQEIDESLEEQDDLLEEQTDQISNEVESLDSEMENVVESAEEAGTEVAEELPETMEIVGEEAAEGAAEAGVEAGLAVPGLDVVFAAIFIAFEAYEITSILTADDKLGIPTQKLNVKFNHNSKAYNANLDQKIDLEATLNFVHNGIITTLPFLSNEEEIPKFRNFTNSLFCKNIVDSEYLETTLTELITTLESELAFEFHDNNQGTLCSSKSNYFPAYREGNIIHFCPGYDQINFNQECKRVIKLAEHLANLLLPFALVALAPVLPILGPLLPLILPVVMQILEGKYLDNQAIDELCNRIHPYHPKPSHIHTISVNFIAGLLSQKPNPVQEPSQCQTMVSNNCTLAEGRLYNQLCIAHFVETIATHYNMTQLIHMQQQIPKNCHIGCDLDSPALDNLLNYVGGYLDTTISNQFFPSLAFPSQNYSSPEVGNIYLAATKHFYDKNTSLMVFALQENGYFEVKAQFLNVTTHPIGIDQQIGRFRNIGDLKTTAFNESAVLVGYSFRENIVGKFNILVEYISPTIKKVLNIFGSYDGEFSFATVKDSSDFLVSYKPNNRTITVKKYTVGQHNITNHNVEITSYSYTHNIRADQSNNNQPYSIPLSLNNYSTTEDFVINKPMLPNNRSQVEIKAYDDKTFDIIWSYLDNRGIFIERYNISTKQSISSITINSNPDFYLVDTNTNGKGVVAWHEINSVHAQMFDTGIQGYAVANISKTDDVLDLRMLDNNNYEALLSNVNSTFNKVLYNGNNGALVEGLEFKIINGAFVDANSDQDAENNSVAQRRRFIAQSSLSDDETDDDRNPIVDRGTTHTDPAPRRMQPGCSKFKAIKYIAGGGVVVLGIGGIIYGIWHTTHLLPHSNPAPTPAPTFPLDAATSSVLQQLKRVTAQCMSEYAVSLLNGCGITHTIFVGATNINFGMRANCTDGAPHYNIDSNRVIVCGNFSRLPSFLPSQASIERNAHSKLSILAEAVSKVESYQNNGAITWDKCLENAGGKVINRLIGTSSPYCVGRYVEITKRYMDAGCVDLNIQTVQHTVCGEIANVGGNVSFHQLLNRTSTALHDISQLINPGVQTLEAYKGLLCNINNTTYFSAVTNGTNQMFIEMGTPLQWNILNLCPGAAAFVYNFESLKQYFPQSVHGVHQLYLCPAVYSTYPFCPQNTSIDYNAPPPLNILRTAAYKSTVTIMIHELAHIALHTGDKYELSFYNERAEQCAIHTPIDGSFDAQANNIVLGSLGYSTSWEYMMRAYLLDTHCP